MVEEEKKGEAPMLNEIERASLRDEPIEIADQAEADSVGAP